MPTDMSEKHFIYVFRVEEEGKQEINKKQAARKVSY
jgi:hypothetical protein